MTHTHSLPHFPSFRRKVGVHRAPHAAATGTPGLLPRKGCGAGGCCVCVPPVLSAVRTAAAVRPGAAEAAAAAAPEGAGDQAPRIGAVCASGVCVQQLLPRGGEGYCACPRSPSRPLLSVPCGGFDVLRSRTRRRRSECAVDPEIQFPAPRGSLILCSLSCCARRLFTLIPSPTRAHTHTLTHSPCTSTPFCCLET